MEELHKKYRPKTLEEVRGNKLQIKKVQSLLEKNSDEIPQAWIFVGPRGTGKTTLVRILSKELECADMNFHEINSSSFTGVDFARQIEENARGGSLVGGNRLYVFNECHRMSPQAQDNLLMVVEEPPPGVFFAFVTTDPEKMRPALVSRCTDVVMNFLNSKDIKKLVKDVYESEYDEEIPNEVLEVIAKASLGAPRDALKILDSVCEMDSWEEVTDCIQEGLIVGDESQVAELCRMMLKPNEHTVKEAFSILKDINKNAEDVRRNILNYMNKVLQNNPQPVAYAIIEQFRDNYYNCGIAGLSADVYDIFEN